MNAYILKKLNVNQTININDIILFINNYKDVQIPLQGLLSIVQGLYQTPSPPDMTDDVRRISLLRFLYQSREGAI